MTSLELQEKYADYFFEKGDGLPPGLEYHQLLPAKGKGFVLAFPMGKEDESGDITVEPYASILAQVKNFREGEKAKIKVTITTCAFFVSDEDEEEFAEIIGGGDDSWRHDFYLFITFLT